jgi:nucleotide-binding universal stress UspA family protein
MILLCYDGSEGAKRAIAGAHATLGHKPSALLGSVSNAVVHHSARPVLVIPLTAR